MSYLPRISRAQNMDALSSQSNIAGYKAVIVGANSLTKYMPLLMTAAGTIKPARVLVLGTGVAGLSAIAQAKRMGAQVFAYDVRSETKEQVESLETGLERAKSLANRVALRSPTALAAFKRGVLASVGKETAERVEIEAIAYEHCVSTGEASIGRSNFKTIRSGEEVKWGPRINFEP